VALIKAAVIPVAGLGTRLLPATRSQPKEMLPVLDKPVVQYVVEELARAGIERVLFVTGRRKRAIEDHFDSGAFGPGENSLARILEEAPGAGVEIMYTRQPRPAGLGEALARAASFAGEGPVVVALGDSIIEPAAGAEPSAGIVTRLSEAYARTGASAAIAVDEVPRASVSRYGIVVPADGARTDDVFELSAVLEKPDPAESPGRHAVMARYVLGPTVFAELRLTAPDSSGEVQLADALRALLARGERVVAVPLAAGERRHDIGTIESYCATFLRYALTDPRFGAELRAQAAALLHGP
jgi:UTP--glucose-1-phosphate uridylyltransferase